MTSKPKVALVGGVDVDARLELVQHLCKDYEICVVGSNPLLHDQFDSMGFQYENYDLPRKVSPLADLRAMFQLARIFQRLKPDIVHTFDTKPGVWGSMAARLSSVPAVIVTFTGLGSLYLTDDLRTRFLRGIYERLQRFASRFINQAIFQNHDDAKQFIDAKIVPREKANVILGSGVNTKRFNPDKLSIEERCALRAELELQPSETVVTMIARLVRTKGVIEFMQAAERVRNKYPDAKFLLVGPEDHDSLDRLTQSEIELLKQSLDLLGPRKDVLEILSISDIFVLPSFREGVPRVLLEAASMGLPIITTDAPGCNEVARDGENGMLIPATDANALGEALLRLLGSPELRQRYGRNSRNLAIAKFDIAVVAQQTKEAYQRQLDEKP